MNAKKTKFMIFKTPQKKIGAIKLKINDNFIEQVKYFNFLGITIDENLNWNEHVNKIALKINKANAVLSRMKKILPVHIKRLIYEAIIHSHLNYGILVWGFNLTRLHRLQKKAIRHITCAKYNAHAEPLIKHLNILKVHDIKTMRYLTFYYRLVNG